MSALREGAPAIDDVLSVHRRRLPASIEQLGAFCRIPSVGGDDAAMDEAVRWLVAVMREAGIETDVLPGGGNHSYLVGTARGAGERTLLFFNHYDIANYTNPVEVRAGERQPFSGAVEDERVYARGVADDKATLLSRIHAVRTWREARGELPLTVTFLLEGKRTLATGALERFLDRHAARVRADACCWEAGSKDESDRPLITLGHKGQLFVELTCRTANADYPSRITALPNAAWRLSWALASIKGPDERVQIAGFYDDVRPITEMEERMFYRRLASDAEGLRRRAGVRRFVKGLSGQDVMHFVYSEPTATICGVTAGHTGPGHKLLTPGEARAHLEFRLVPDQDPDRILAALRAHLEAQGFDDVEISVLGANPPYSIPAGHPLVGLVAEASRETYGIDPVIVPFATGIGSRYLFRKYTAMPIVGFAIGYAGSLLETNDEHIRIRDYEEGMRHILHLFGRADRIPRLEAV
ncbi:MAG TPA: M20/M25/M40 family metallo-hydrolase [bacterium]|nr:M20/M25/M40 family metallo-hydrolase [bacterium]